MRDVNAGYILRYTHANVASFFFIFVYAHIARGLFYSSYKAPRAMVWNIGVIILIVMMATAFLGYVLPYGQMSLWGMSNQMVFLPITLKRNLQLSASSKNIANFSDLKFNDKDLCKIIEIFVGIIDGDGYFDIGVQKQISKNLNKSSKSTIRIRLGINLQYKDKDLLYLLANKLKVGKIDYSESKNQYRLILYKKDILKFIYPYLKINNIEFLTYNRRKQFFLFKYIVENNIKHWDNLNLQEIDNLFYDYNKKLNFLDIINLPYFNNWLVGFTIAEGSFHVKSKGTAHFSIVQSGIENYSIIKAIHYFIKGNDSINHQIRPENSVIYRISFSSKKDINFVINFFNNNNLLGLKKIQFDNWKSFIYSKNNINNNAQNVNLIKVNTNLTNNIESNKNVCNE